MAKKKRKIVFLIAAGLSLIGIVLPVFFASPDTSYSLLGLTLPIYFLTFFCLFIFLYSLTAYIFRSFIHGILVGLFPVVYLSMRLNDLTSLFFFVLLFAIFVILELLLVQFTKQSPSK